MTTDITELAQSLKAAAEKATPGPWGVARDSKTLVSNQSHPIATVSDAMHRMLADGSTGKDAEFIALANPANIRALVEALEKAQQRIAELESRIVKLPKFKMLEDYLAEVAIEERKQILVGVKLEFHRALTAAGIKVEAE
ncbi:TPA: ead/Ea22-like family protein [Raoultella planticola]